MLLFDISPTHLFTQAGLCEYTCTIPAFIVHLHEPVVDNVVDNYIHNTLPIYLLYLPEMRLVHRSDINQLLQPGIQSMTRAYLNIKGSQGKKEEHIKQMVKDQTKYAILSHRWLDGGELTFQDLLKLESISVAGLTRLMKSFKRLKLQHGAAILDQAMAFSDKEDARCGMFKQMEDICKHMSTQGHAPDFVKLVKFCKVAQRCQCNYVWMDTGCINKQSSTDVEESIRSMFGWYRGSHICIVHLGGTPAPYNMGHDAWFTRGWTLQELLAPKAIKFFSSSWRPLTAKPNDKMPDDKLGIPLWKIISAITKIPVTQLLNFEPGIINVREKMAWMSKRQTTRIEDMAYCLIGIFNIPLSIAYGEGQMAFYRLQAEIVQRSPDRGLFAWCGLPSSLNSMFAARPEAFFPHEGLTAGVGVAGLADPTYALTNHGLRIPLSIYDVQHIEALGTDAEEWITHNLEVQELGEIEVECKSLPKDSKLTIGILGNITGGKSIAIVLISPKIGSQGYKRMTTKNVIQLPSKPWKEPEAIFIE
jgi:Heterokaryon incompatibility protein (HET)